MIFFRYLFFISRNIYINVYIKSKSTAIHNSEGGGLNVTDRNKYTRTENLVQKFSVSFYTHWMIEFDLIIKNWLKINSLGPKQSFI